MRAYKGQAGNLVSNNTVLDAALQIHSVEARHAAEVRRLNARKGWPEGTDGNGPAPGKTDAIYAGEENTTQAGVNIATISSSGVTMTAASASAAFDEPLDKAAVLAIAGNYIF